MHKTGMLLTGLLVAAPAVHAGGASGLNSDFVFNGGGTGGYFYSNNTGSNNNDDIHLSDFLLEVNTKQEGQMGSFSATAGAGTFLNVNVFNGGVVGIQESPQAFDLHYGYLSGMMPQGAYVDAGLLATRIGYESFFSHANPNALLSGLFQAQPTYYPGIRAGFDWEKKVDFFGEVTNDTSQGGTNSWMLGVGGQAEGFEYSVIWNNVDDGRSGLDVVLSAMLQNIEVAANFDWYTLESDVQPGEDDSAWGLALYAVPKFWLVSMPVRFEWLSDGDSQVFGPAPGLSVDSAWEFTFTPTYYFTDNAFGRLEIAYVSADNDVFLDDKGELKDTNWAANAQLGMRF